MNDSFVDLDATAQAELVRRGEVRPVELVDAAIARIERYNDTLNAVTLSWFDEIRDAAAADRLGAGPFRGVPFLLKDLGAPAAGRPVSGGMRLLKEAGYRDTESSHFAAKLERAGFAILGRTNSPELGLLPTTEPDAWGPTRNPWDTDHGAGGSSGGSGAAVAAGLVPVAHASDGGGSIRIPASHCGLVGLKPSRGRISFGPAVGERWGGFSNEHVVSHSVRDSAAILDVLAGPMPGDPYSAPSPERPFAESARPGDGKFRIALLAKGIRNTELHPACGAAAEHTAAILRDRGHIVEAAHPAALDDGDVMRAFVTVVALSTAAALDSWGKAVGRPVTEDDVEPLTWAIAENGRQRGATDYLEALAMVHDFRRSIASWWATSGYDLLLTPTCGEPPPTLGQFAATTDNPFSGFIRAAPFSIYTSSFNMTGQPAISLPSQPTTDGLPVGAHLVAAWAREDQLLQVAAEIEEVERWTQRRPKIWAGNAD